MTLLEGMRASSSMIQRTKNTCHSAGTFLLAGHSFQCLKGFLLNDITRGECEPLLLSFNEQTSEISFATQSQ